MCKHTSKNDTQPQHATPRPRRTKEEKLNIQR